jgi:acetyltransferase-like isoleucine patch superfamily enzyme
MMDGFNLVYLTILIAFSYGLFQFPLQIGISTLFIRIPCALIGFVSLPCAIYYFLPKLTEGKHQMPFATQSLSWIFKFYIKRPLSLPLVLDLLGSFHFLQYFMYRCFRCQIDYSFQIAANVFICDPELVRIDKNVTIGAWSTLASHMLIGPILRLKPIHLKEGSSIGAHCKVSYGVTMERKSVIGASVTINHSCSIGEGSVISNGVILGSGAQIGKQVKIGEFSQIGKGVRIPDNTIIEPFSHITKWPTTSKN